MYCHWSFIHVLFSSYNERFEDCKNYVINFLSIYIHTSQGNKSLLKCFRRTLCNTVEPIIILFKYHNLELRLTCTTRIRRMERARAQIFKISLFLKRLKVFFLCNVVGRKMIYWVLLRKREVCLHINLFVLLELQYINA